MQHHVENKQLFKMLHSDSDLYGHLYTVFARVSRLKIFLLHSHSAYHLEMEMGQLVNVKKMATIQLMEYSSVSLFPSV